ncbi:MAG: hypothetical protein RLZZ271_59 [Pseudomonadota bacterium]|jgi:hypothetical protein
MDANQQAVPAKPTGNALPEGGRVEGRKLFQELVPLFIEEAARLGWNQLYWMDPDFSDWPLGDRRTYAALQSWSRKGRRMYIHAHRFDVLMSTHHRFVNWRRQWAHIVECWQCPQSDAADFPSTMYSSGWSLRRLDRGLNLCVISAIPEQLQALEELRQDWLEKSVPGFPAHVLGL